MRPVDEHRLPHEQVPIDKRLGRAVGPAQKRLSALQGLLSPSIKNCPASNWNWTDGRFSNTAGQAAGVARNEAEGVS